MSIRGNSSNRNFIATLVILISFVLVGCEGASEDSGGGGGGSDKVLGSAACLTDFANIVSQINLADPTEGGLLYDKWWAATGGNAPATDNPLWVTQNTNTRSGADTWRCKECHGWDYAGNEGVYGNTSNSHYTGFPGVLPAAGDSPINIFCAIHSGTNIDARHNFSTEIDQVNILHLTKFIVETQTGATPRGMIDTAPHISATGAINGASTTNGQSVYTTAGCADAGCHGPNGDAQHEPLAELATGNPWETLHKIRFGHPGSVPMMPSYSDPSNPASQQLTLLQSKDVLAYTQTLAPAQPTACTTDFAGLVGQIALADSQQGGQLYDKWWVAAGAAAPTSDHPLWSTQNTNIRTGADTWRCKECHGWDYDGNLGVYGDTANSHYTGFPSLLARTAGAQPIDVFCAIRSGSGINPAHNFTTVMSDTQILHLTKFITETRTGTMPQGLIDTSSLFQADGTSNGNSGTGASLYSSMGCASSNCHGPNGDVQHEPLAVLAVDNPWETIHKIRFGHPGSVPLMPAFSETHTLAQANDVVAYSQTLTPPAGGGGGGGGGTPPPTSEAATIALGGRLYDNWISETGAAVPPVDNPIWDLQNTNNRTGSATWRCKECHGWDYKGAAGVYGNPSSSHYTGFGGILDTEKTEQEIVSYLTNGFFLLGENVHVFNMLSTAEKEALAKFIKQGMVDSSPYFGNTILANGTVIINGSQANFENGANLYTFQGIGVLTPMCSLCHGDDGLGEPGVDLGNIARVNPWEFLHKIRFGQPATEMPSMYDALDPLTGGLAFDIQDSVDIIQYSQSLNP